MVEESAMDFKLDQFEIDCDFVTVLDKSHVSMSGPQNAL